MRVLAQMAQDKRHELAPGAASYWREKLAEFRDQEIAAALMAYSGEFFPSVDTIAELARQARLQGAQRRKFKPCGVDGCHDGWRYLALREDEYMSHMVERCKCWWEWKNGRARDAGDS